MDPLLMPEISSGSSKKCMSRYIKLNYGPFVLYLHKLIRLDPDPEVGSVILRIRTPTTTEVKPKILPRKVGTGCEEGERQICKKPEYIYFSDKNHTLIKSGGL